MPTYEYHCNSCQQDIEIFQSMKDDRLTTCPRCQESGQFQRKISGGAGIIFKGSGFYETDYKKKSGSEASSTKQENKTTSETKPSVAKKTSDKSSSSKD